VNLQLPAFHEKSEIWGLSSVSDVQLFREALSGTLDQERRPVRLHWGKTQASLEQALLVQRLEIAEGLMTGIAGHLTCLSSRADLPGRREAARH
jgi:type VI secretion system secreted protein VgrG